MTTQGTDARSAKTVGLGPKGDGPVGNADAPNTNSLPRQVEDGPRVVSFQRTLWSAVWERFVEGDFEMEINDLVTDDAVHAGMVEQVEFDPEQHTDVSGSCYAGDPFYQITPLGQSLLAGASTPIVRDTAQRREAGWLIEQHSNAVIDYVATAVEEWPRLKSAFKSYEIELDEYLSPIRYVKDAGNALRFARREDAESFVALFRRFLLTPVIAEHAWPSIATIPDPVADTVERDSDAMRALEAWRTAQQATDDAVEHIECAIAEGWSNDPSGSGWIAESNRRADAAWKRAIELRDAALSKEIQQ